MKYALIVFIGMYKTGGAGVVVAGYLNDLATCQIEANLLDKKYGVDAYCAGVHEGVGK